MYLKDVGATGFLIESADAKDAASDATKDSNEARSGHVDAVWYAIKDEINLYV